MRNRVVKSVAPDAAPRLLGQLAAAVAATAAATEQLSRAGDRGVVGGSVGDFVSFLLISSTWALRLNALKRDRQFSGRVIFLPLTTML